MVSWRCSADGQAGSLLSIVAKGGGGLGSGGGNSTATPRARKRMRVPITTVIFTECADMASLS